MIETTYTKTTYRENENGEIVVIDEQVIQKPQEDINAEARQFLSDTDWKIIRHIDEKNAGETTSLTDEEYQTLFAQRQEARNLIM